MQRICRLGQILRAAALVAVILSAVSAGTASFASVLAPIASDIPDAVTTATRIGPVDSGSHVSVDIVFPLRNEQAAADYADHVSRPFDPLYGQYLTPEAFAFQFGPSAGNYDAVVAWAESAGLTVTQRSVSRTILSLTGTTDAVDAAFNVHLDQFKSADGTTFFSADNQPQIPASIASTVTAVIGLSNYARVRPLFHVQTQNLRDQAVGAGLVSPESSLGTGNGHYGAYDAHDLNIAYSMPGGVFQGDGQTLAVYEDGGFYPNDPVRYEKFNNLPDVPVTVRNVNGYNGAVNDPGVALEAALDIEMEIAIAPDAKQVLVYEDGDYFDTSLINALAAVADDNKTSILSISYGLDEVLQGRQQILAENHLFVELAAEGISVLAASGDNGCVGDSGSGLNALDPGSNPYVTCVGGTSLYYAYRLYEGEETWNHLGIGGGATGGGVSREWPIPSYQTPYGFSVATANGGSAKHRNVPDIAAVADPLTPVDVSSAAYKGGWVPVGGTSASTPIWAGYMALVNQARNLVNLHRIGFANPAIYDVGTNPFLSFFDFNDIIDGNNGNLALFGTNGFTAGFGYDNVTGFGSMIGNQLLTDLASQASAAVDPPDPPTGLAGTGINHGVVLTWKHDSTATGYFVYEVTPFGSLVPVGGTIKGTYTVSGLANGTQYEFMIAAVNRGGLTYAAYPIFVPTGV